MADNTNVWGIPIMTPVEFYKLKRAKAGLADALGGGGGGGMSFRMAPGRRLTSGFGPVNLGGGLMNPAQALHEFNLERNKYTVDSPYYQEQAIFSGEKPAQDFYNAAVAAGTNWDKPQGYTADELAGYIANANAHTDTQGTIMNWGSAPEVTETVWGNSPVQEYANYDTGYVGTGNYSGMSYGL